MITRSLKNPFLISTAIALALAPMAYSQDAETGSETVTTTTDAAAEEAETRTLERVVVRGEFIPEPQRATSQVASFLSSEDLLRQGDDNAALALTRLSGLSIVSGKFAYVRGLGDRYSVALLNGSPLPSPEPLRRTVPLDLFPSNVLDGAAVQKTFSANYPAEFGGGLIDLKTIKQPTEPFLNLKIGLGSQGETTSAAGIYVRGSDTDWTGYDDGLRDLPGGVDALISSGGRLSDLSSAQIETLGESFVNSPLSVIQTSDLGPNTNASIDGGMTFDYGDFDIGLVGVLGYDQSWKTEEAIRQLVQGDELGADLRATETTLDVTVNGLGSASLGWGENEIQGTLFYVHSTSKEAQIETGPDFNAPGSGIVQRESSGWFERELTFFQLAGEHALGDFEIDWRGSVSQSTRDAPYERSLQRIVENGVPLYSRANSYAIRFSELQDDLASLGGDLTYPLALGDYREAVLSAGFDVSQTERESLFLGFRFAGGNSLPLDIQAARPDFLFSADNIDPARFVLQEGSSTNDNYTANLDIEAVYAQADVEVTDFIRATLGGRFEQAEQSVQTFDRFGNLGAGTVNLQNDYLLPAATVTWNFADDLQLRLGYSETVARPQFRELAESSYFDPDTDRIYRGNSGLVDSELTNYDARLEYYLGRDQFVTVAGFYKEIENPIEEFQFSTATFVFETSFINSPKAELFGGELEYRTRFAMPIDLAWFNDREWLFSTNYTYTSSEIIAEAGDSVFEPVSRTLVPATDFGLDGSNLQGTPENILNVQFGWESDLEQMTLLLGWVDERILQRGIPTPGAELPDIIEKPGVQLDLVYRRDFNFAGQDFTLGLSGRNLLNEAHEEFQVSEELGRTEFNTYDRGTSLSASLTAKF